MRVQDLNTARKLLLVFGSLLLTLMVACGAMVSMEKRALRAAQASGTAAAVRDNVDQILGGMHDQNASVRGLILYRLPRYVDKYRNAAGLIAEVSAIARAQAVEATEVLDDLDRIAQSVKAWQTEIGDPAVTIGLDAARRDEAVATTVSEHASTLYTDVRQAVATARTHIQAWADGAAAEQNRSATLSMIALAGGCLGTVGLMLVFWIWLTRTIAGPVAGMTRAMNALAAGDTDIAVPATERRDEIGRMAEAVEHFRSAAIAQRQIEQDMQAAREAAEDERNRRAAADAETARQQAAVVSALAGGLAALAQGDLLVRIEQPFSAAYDSLRRDFNGTASTLHSSMAVVSANATAIRSGTEQIAAAAQDLSRRTEQQAASLEETAAALEEITQTGKQTALGASQTRMSVSAAKADAEGSSAVVADAVAAMASIETSSRQIGQIIGVVDEIAFQTNLLALNAGVEAARAGDAGRGFAVVASEVRGLAQRSAEAAKQIKALVSTSGQQVAQGVTLVGRAGEALERIRLQITEIDSAVDSMVRGASEQSTALNEVSIAVTQMDGVTQQNAAMVEETTAASRSLADETDGLAELIGRFRLHLPSAPAAPRVRPPAVALKPTGPGGAARQPRSETEWEEF